MLTSAAARLRTAKALMSGSGMRSASPPMSKFWTELCAESQRQHTLQPRGLGTERGARDARWLPHRIPVPRLEVTTPALALWSEIRAATTPRCLKRETRTLTAASGRHSSGLRGPAARRTCRARRGTCPARVRWSARETWRGGRDSRESIATVGQRGRRQRCVWAIRKRVSG